MALSADAKTRLKYALNNETDATEVAAAVDANTVARTANTAALAWTATTEHGAGAVGTGVAPTTTRRTENGHIITDIKVDIKGFASVTTANDVIGKAGVAYIGRNVVANNGIIYKIEMICVQVPATGDTDINLVANASAALEADGAGGTAYGVDGGTWTAGKTVANLVQGLTANHYFYLTQGGTSAGTYTTGQFIIRLYGHPVLT